MSATPKPVVGSHHCAHRAAMQHNGAMDEAIFEIPLWWELLAVGVGALMGAMFASRFKDHHLDLLGVAIIGVSTGLGGGVLRDLVLSVPVATFQSNWYLIVAVGASFLGMLLERLFTKFTTLFTVVDALNLGLFAAIGATKGIAFGVPAVPAALLGVLTAVGGSILRDVLMVTPVELLKVGPLYAAAAILGTTTLVTMTTLGVPFRPAAITCVVITFVARMVGFTFGLRLPEQRRLGPLRRPSRLRPPEGSDTPSA